MSGDGKDDITIPMLFLFHKEGHQLIEALDKRKHLLVYLGDKAKQPGRFLIGTKVLPFFGLVYFRWNN